MRISVAHSTTYRYTSPVYLEPHTIRLRPREDATQRLHTFALDIEPAPVRRAEVLDQDGNVVTHAWFSDLTDRLVLHIRFTLDTLRDNPFDFLLLDNDRDLPVQYAEALRGPLLPYLRADHDPEVRAFAQQIANESAWNTLGFIGALNRTLYQETRHVIRHDGAAHAPRAHARRAGRLLPRYRPAFLRRLPRHGDRGPLRQRL